MKLNDSVAKQQRPKIAKAKLKIGTKEFISKINDTQILAKFQIKLNSGQTELMADFIDAMEK